MLSEKFSKDVPSQTPEEFQSFYDKAVENMTKLTRLLYKKNVAKAIGVAEKLLNQNEFSEFKGLLSKIYYETNNVPFTMREQVFGKLNEEQILENSYCLIFDRPFFGKQDMIRVTRRFGVEKNPEANFDVVFKSPNNCIKVNFQSSNSLTGNSYYCKATNPILKVDRGNYEENQKILSLNHLTIEKIIQIFSKSLGYEINLSLI